MDIRPVIVNYKDPAKYLADMLVFRRNTEAAFSVLQACKPLKKCSPALVSLICKGKRSLTSDRVNDLSRLMNLNAGEKQYFRDWIDRIESKGEQIEVSVEPPRSKAVSTHLLQDWLNVYVKDAFGLEEIRENPERIFAFLGGIASQARIEKSIKFLLSNGYLRKDPNGRIVLDSPLAITDEGLPNIKIRQFHKAALKIAKDGIDKYPVQERLANALVVPVDENGLEELLEISREYAEKLKVFCDKYETKNKKRLYQVLINISPTGGEV